ncbi:uncharacterized protein LOC117221953 isoform X1 [Megalopta genalis]|uniref:uncharacterized protein LOC117221953 isoform X1 n=1 Tax=Megalopta genalis TaxID=115081 RepID=UPI003FCFA28A
MHFRYRQRDCAGHGEKGREIDHGVSQRRRGQQAERGIRERDEEQQHRGAEAGPVVVGLGQGVCRANKPRREQAGRVDTQRGDRGGLQEESDRGRSGNDHGDQPLRAVSAHASVDRFAEAIEAEPHSGRRLGPVRPSTTEPEQREPNDELPRLPLLRLEVREHNVHVGVGAASPRHGRDRELSAPRPDEHGHLEERAAANVVGGELPAEDLQQDRTPGRPDHHTLDRGPRFGGRLGQILRGLSGEDSVLRRGRPGQGQEALGAQRVPGELAADGPEDMRSQLRGSRREIIVFFQSIRELRKFVPYSTRDYLYAFTGSCACIQLRTMELATINVSLSVLYQD